MHSAIPLPPQVSATRNMRRNEEHMIRECKRLSMAHSPPLTSRPQQAWSQQPECSTEDWQASSVRSSSNHTAWQWDGSTAALIFPCYDQRSHAYEAPDHPTTAHCAQPFPQTSQLIWSQPRRGRQGVWVVISYQSTVDHLPFRHSMLSSHSIYLLMTSYYCAYQRGCLVIV